MDEGVGGGMSCSVLPTFVCCLVLSRHSPRCCCVLLCLVQFACLLCALRPATPSPRPGTLAWRVALPVAPVMSPLVDAGDVVYVGTGPAVWALDVGAKGSAVWQYTYVDPSSNSPVASSAAVDTLGRLTLFIDNGGPWCPVVFLSTV